MRILIITDQVDYHNAINPLLARRVAGELAGMGHTVHLLELWDGEHPLPPAPEKVERFALAFPQEAAMNRALEHGRAGGSALKRLIRLGLCPPAWEAAFRQLVLKEPLRQKACLAFLEHHPDYEAVVAVGAPFWSAFALAQARIPGKKAVWMMDPYSANREYTAPGGAEKELAMGNAMARIFITRLMEKDYQEGPLAPLQKKTQVLEFPCLVPGQPVPPKKPGQGLELVFCGNLYPNIRTPWALLELMTRLENPDIHLTMIGGGWEHFDPDQVEEYRRKLGDRLEIARYLPYPQAQKRIAAGDVLVNIGNDVANQLPSKIFDYFGTGKPILQLAARMDDPANPYFSRYPLAMIQGPGEDPRRVEEWLSTLGDHRLTYEQVSQLFWENTPSAVANRLLEGLQEDSV